MNCCECYQERIKQLEFRVTFLETNQNDLLHRIELLKNDKEILIECLNRAQIKIGKDTKPNFIDSALALVSK